MPLQVLLCGWMVFEAARIAYEQKLPVVCGVFDASQTRIAFVLWVFYLSKILDFFDTFFIVVRGKWEQLSVLHVYHHFSIFLVYWVVVSDDGSNATRRLCGPLMGRRSPATWLKLLRSAGACRQPQQRRGSGRAVAGSERIPRDHSPKDVLNKQKDQ